MNRNSSSNLFTGLYSLIRGTGIFRTSLGRRAFISSYFLYKRNWEDPFWLLAQTHPELFRGGHILDIGANVGYTACLFAQLADPRCQVFAFEPDAENFALLADVIRRKKLAGRVVPIQSAVGSSEGHIQFWHNEAHSGDHRVITEQFAATVPDAAQISAVPLTSVDAFASSRNLGKVAFIKIDVQGYEPVVCQGMKRTICDSLDVCVCCEYAPHAMIDLGFQAAELLEFFRSGGFQIYILDRSSLTLASDHAEIQRLAAHFGYVDLLCLRKPLK